MPRFRNYKPSSKRLKFIKKLEDNMKSWFKFNIDAYVKSIPNPSKYDVKGLIKNRHKNHLTGELTYEILDERLGRMVLKSENELEYVIKPTEKCATIKPYCAHKNKEKRRLIITEFWYCPDCKTDLGDA